NEISLWHELRLNTWWGKPMYGLALTLLLIKISFLVYMAYLYHKYKAVTSVSDEELPLCTVIVPAYNEGYLVYETLLSLADSKYPIAKLQIYLLTTVVKTIPGIGCLKPNNN